MFSKFFQLFPLIFLVTTLPAFAQKITPPTPQTIPPLDRPVPPIEPKVQPLPSLPELEQKLPKPQSPPIMGDQSMQVKGFEIIGNTRFSQAELQAAIAAKLGDFTAQPLTFGQVLQAADVVTQYYLDRKYLTTGALVPANPQPKLKDGIVTIQVVEGTIGEIRVQFPEGKRQRIQNAYVSDRIRATVPVPLNIDELREGLQLLTLNPLLQNLQATLTPGTGAGKSDLIIKVEEARSLGAELLLDNNRSPSVGSFRRQIQVNEGNFTGLGDNFAIVYSNTNGSNLGNLSYTVPLNAKGGTLGLNLGISASRIIEEPFNVLDIDARSFSMELSYRQPIVLKPTREFALGASLGWRTSEATLLNGLTPFPSIGAEADGQTRVSTLKFFQDATWRGSSSVFALRSQFNIGLGILGTVNDRGPDSRSLSWLGQAQWVKDLGPGSQWVLRGEVQFADRNLLPSEQLGIGGQSSVRGYRQDALLTDAGLVASAEYRFPLYRSPSWLIQAAPFVDIGTGWNLGENPDPTTRTIASLGLGLRFQTSDRFSARFDWGLPLIKLAEPIAGRNKSLQENGFYFSLVYKFL
jgi:hemolysin activation/secretion protein